MRLAFGIFCNTQQLHVAMSSAIIKTGDSPGDFYVLDTRLALGGGAGGGGGRQAAFLQRVV